MKSQEFPKPEWLKDEDFKPYVLLHPTNQFSVPQPRRHRFDWFGEAPLLKNPLRLSELEFANSVLLLDELMFAGADLGMPRWVFYDCAVLPGLVTGFAARASALPAEVKTRLRVSATLEWVPLSLFIIIPMIKENHWMAHNLCSVNELIPKEFRYKGLGFLSKAFGLWYANVEYLFGVTQWLRPALKLHANYGYFELVTAYSPIHSYPRSLTYRLKVDASHWRGFFDHKHPQGDFDAQYVAAGLTANPRDEDNLRELQQRIENGEGPFILSGKEILSKQLGEPLAIYRPRS